MMIDNATVVGVSTVHNTIGANRPNAMVLGFSFIPKKSRRI